MEMESVRVTPGMLPPIISTTPNSPTVWVNASTAAVNRKGRTNGSNTRTRILPRPGDRSSAASRMSRSTERKPEVMGCTAKGQAEENRADHQPSERERQRMTKDH